MYLKFGEKLLYLLVLFGSAGVLHFRLQSPRLSIQQLSQALYSLKSWKRKIEGGDVNSIYHLHSFFLPESTGKHEVISKYFVLEMQMCI